MNPCPYCHRTDRQVKAGLNRGAQRYKCMYCGRRYMPTGGQHAGYPDDLRQTAVQLHEQGVPVSEIGRRLDIRPRSVAGWLRRGALEPRTTTAVEPVIRERPVHPRTSQKPRPTASDVAARAGVSVTTVSNFINHKGGMSKATQDRIESAMKELHFAPNSLVRAIRQRRTHVLGLLADAMSDLDSRIEVSITPPMLAGVDEAASAADQDILIFTGWPRQRRYNGLNFFNGQVDGLVWFAAERERDILNVVAAGGLPVVALLTRHVPESVGFVNCDNINGMKLAVDHLAEIGRKRIAYCGNLGASNMADRRTGYRLALSQLGMPFDPQIETANHNIWTKGYLARMIDRWLQLPDPPDAIATAGDAIADWLITLLRDRGVRVPEDIAVTGFDDIPAAERLCGGLTTIHQPFHQVASTAVELLLSIIKGASPTDCRVTLPTKLVVRASTIGG